MGNEPYVRIFTPSISHNRARNVAIASRLVDKVQDRLKDTFGLRDVRVQVCDDDQDFPAKAKFQRYEFTVAVFIDFEICLGTCEVSDQLVGEAAAFIMTLWCQQDDYSSRIQSSMDNSITESDDACQTIQPASSQSESSEFNDDFFKRLSDFAAQMRKQDNSDEGC